MGSTTYYQAVLRAQELAAVAKTAAELASWAEWSVFERFQRELAMRRVRKEIVPYLVRTKDRFFGSLIVLVYQPDLFQFETVDTFNPEIGNAYNDAARRMGFLSIDGGDLVVLDGQHRLAALREVVTAGPELDGPYRDAVGNDELCVVFIEHENFEKTRRIFNKVNRYAKPTSTSDNIITSEDDGLAIVTRWLVEPTPPLELASPLPPLNRVDRFGEPIVEWRSTRLSPDAQKITTLNHLYQTVGTILEANGISDFDERSRVNRPSDSELRSAYEFAAHWWSLALDEITAFERGLRQPDLIPDFRRYRAPESLLFRPIAQVALFKGIAESVSRGLQLELAFKRANELDWCAASDLWADTIIFGNGRMNARKEAVNVTGELIAYCIAADLYDETDKMLLEMDLEELTGIEGYELPEPL